MHERKRECNQGSESMAAVLICDNEARLRAVLKLYAQLEGHEVTEAENGLEAVEACKVNSFDIIIIDVAIPGYDGFSAVEEIRKTSNVPIIILTVRDTEYDKKRGFELGIADYIVKPFSSKEIMLRISTILKRTDSSLA